MTEKLKMINHFVHKKLLSLDLRLRLANPPAIALVPETSSINIDFDLHFDEPERPQNMVFSGTGVYMALVTA